MIILIACDLRYVLFGSDYDAKIIVIMVLCHVWILINCDYLTWGHDGV